MKACKGLILFCFLGIAVSACFDPPVFTDSPEISVNKILFKDVKAPNLNDSLILYLDFKDGDGDLGLKADMNDYPYNESFYFLANGTVVGGKGQTSQVITQVVYSSDGTESYSLVRVGSNTGKLVTNKTRTQPNYGYLPAYNPNDCEFYVPLQLLVAEADHIVDATYNIIDTLQDQNSNKFFLVDDIFLFETNPNHNNIDVRFWVFENGSYVEFDWFKEFCQPDFNGRFPYIPHRIGEPMEGTMRYAMANTSFLQIFSVKKLKLKIKIRDRALNVSNEVETPQFDLQGICTNCD